MPDLSQPNSGGRRLDVEIDDHLLVQLVGALRDVLGAIAPPEAKWSPDVLVSARVHQLIALEIARDELRPFIPPEAVARIASDVAARVRAALNPALGLLSVGEVVSVRPAPATGPTELRINPPVPDVCAQCAGGDHGAHRRDHAGICIGCLCEAVPE